MSAQSLALLTLSVVSASALTGDRFITHAGGVPAAGDNCLGVNRSKADAAGEIVPVDVIGTAVVDSGAAILANALIQTDAQGRAITKAAGATLARMAPGQVATAAGQKIEVLLIVN
ncbi:capsid cement protein [Hydrocarboniphaga effusa]|uniref:capsid cement protein n=1 Tax=Hydrocarboniphaga effusa TaxID=243629 RepID=UPI003BAA3808